MNELLFGHIVYAVGIAAVLAIAAIIIRRTGGLRPPSPYRVDDGPRTIKK